MKPIKLFLLSILISSCSTDQSATKTLVLTDNGQIRNNRSEAPWGEDKFKQDRKPASTKGLRIGDYIDYEIKNNDTLMLISFNHYGNFNRWREILSINPIKAKELYVGDIIKIPRPETPFVREIRGLPYLIKKGDTLGTISDEKYGTPKKWKKIYKNNLELIKDPNKIYAGFTIYYKPIELPKTL